ncbi:hypothetical protein ACOME3_001554 [Neoechinorhynchus agilis]
MQKRLLNSRSYPFNQSEPISGNYYPVCNRISINDTRTHFGVVTDRTQGGYSFKRPYEPGNTIELMINRRTVKDDGLGVDEVLNETVIGSKDGIEKESAVLFRHLIIVGPVENTETNQRRLAIIEAATPIVFLEKEKLEIIPLPKIQPLPYNLHLLSFEVILRNRDTNVYLLRLEHIDPVKHDKNAINFNLQDLFPSSIEQIIQVNETFLAGNGVKNIDLGNFHIMKSIDESLPIATKRLPSLSRYSPTEHKRNRPCGDRVYFCPTNSFELMRDLSASIENAVKCVQIALFAIDSTEILNSIKKCRYRDIPVRMICDFSQLQEQTRSENFEELYAAGVVIRTPPHPPILHHKFIIIDENVVFNGSMNMTDISLRNYENVVVMGRENGEGRQIAREFSQYFQALWNSIGEACQSIMKGRRIDEDTCVFAPERMEQT